jgi:hypothetical protein
VSQICLTFPYQKPPQNAPKITPKTTPLESRLRGLFYGSKVLKNGSFLEITILVRLTTINRLISRGLSLFLDTFPHIEVVGDFAPRL